MKNDKQILVCDWNPNGTNDILLAINGEIQQYGLDEVTFGINVGNYDHFECDGIQVAEVPLKDIIERLAISPVRSRAESYKRLMSFLNDSQSKKVGAM
jgi:hypothetical protein